MGSRTSAILPRLKPKQPPDPSGRHQNSAIAPPVTGQAFARAVKLWEQLGSPSEFLHLPHGQSRYHMYRGEFDLALRLDEELLRVSRDRCDSTGLVLGHLASGRTLMLIGKLALSRLHLGNVTALY